MSNLPLDKDIPESERTPLVEWLLKSKAEQQQIIDKLQFDNISICQTDEEWQAYLKQLGITSQSGVKLVTEAALLGSAIEHGLSPDMIILSDGAKQFAILVHALCWVHTRRKISGGTRDDDGRRARDTFTGLKKTCRKLAYSFWQYLMSRLKGDDSVPYLPDVIREKASAKNKVFSIPIEVAILT